jgi:hypothetical protein
MVTTVTAPASAGRGLKSSRLRCLSEIVLITGTTLAILAAFGPIWSVRLGVAAAIVTAELACIFAWRELYAARRAHAQVVLKATREHGAALTEERTRNAAVVAALTTRVSDAGKLIERQRRRIAEQRLQITDLKTDQVYLKGEVEYRDKVILTLRETVREREAELIALRDESDAQVHHMPRRVLAEHEALWEELTAAEDTISDGSLPAVVDLKMIEMVLPNYEADRQPA